MTKLYVQNSSNSKNYNSACYAALNRWEEAAEDGKQCIIVDRSFVKGYFRLALAYQNLNNLDGALEAIKRGLGIDSANADLKKMSREVEESMRVKRVEAAIASAESQIAANDIPSAYKTIDNALRLDPGNTTLNNMMNRVKPQFERLEKSRVSSLSREERVKEEGDTKFKNADFEGAITAYTKCLDLIRDKVMNWNKCFLITLITRADSSFLWLHEIVICR